MRPAEYRTKIEALGLERQFVAVLTGVTVSRIYTYQREGRVRDVPPVAAGVLADLEREFDLAAERIARDAESPEVEHLLRYPDEAAFHEAVPELDGWPLGVQPFLLAEVQRRLGDRIGIEYAS
jgi:hypothetical protein